MDVGHLTDDRVITFNYYEGTHGLQLKGCCNGFEMCPFSSDKFVSVSDRTWKAAHFVCKKGTTKVCSNLKICTMIM